MAQWTVKKMAEQGSKQWGVYRDGILIEGGFFSRAYAMDAMEGWINAYSNSALNTSFD